MYTGTIASSSQTPIGGKATSLKILGSQISLDIKYFELYLIILSYFSKECWYTSKESIRVLFERLLGHCLKEHWGSTQVGISVLLKRVLGYCSKKCWGFT